MVSQSEGLINVFISSTFRDLKDERDKIFRKLNQATLPIGMEFFIPEGKTSQEIALFDEQQGIINADLVIFLISPLYGSLITECKFTDRCKADCPMKLGSHNPISYTHCEYKFAKAEKKNCQVYLFDKKGWEADQILLQMKDTIDWKQIRENHVFKDYPNEFIELMYKNKDRSEIFKKEIQIEFVPTIDSTQISEVASNFAKIIERWYSEGKINFKNFYGRRDALSDLIKKSDSSVEVFGVGGIGKTTLVQIALLIQKLKGKKILTIGKKQSYLSGSGYDFFREKCSEDIFEITTNLITINDILEALQLKAALKIESVEERIQAISKKIFEDDLLIFIDDFHLADNDVKSLVSQTKGFIIASKSNTGITQKELQLFGIEETDREKLIDLTCQEFGKDISLELKKKISRISEGHPITIELLIRNFDKIDLTKYENLKTDVLIQSNPQQVDEFFNRVIVDILSNEALRLIKILSVLNTEIENNIHKDTILKTIPMHDKNQVFNELINTGLIKKKKESEGSYQFSYKHIKEALRDNDKELHHIAINYYKNKINWVEKKRDDKIGKIADDEVEILYHSLIFDPNTDHTNTFIQIAKKIEPTDYNFKRFIGIGERIKNKTTPEKQLNILIHLGIKYFILHRYKEAKLAFVSYLSLIEKIYSTKKWEYLSHKRPILVDLGNIYDNINKYNESEDYYLQALEISEQLLERFPTIENKIELAKVLQNLGNIQKRLGQFFNAEESYNRSLNFQYEIAQKKRILYSDEVATGLHNLAGLYYQLENYNLAEKKYREALEILSKLLLKNRSKYEPLYFKCNANLGSTCLALENFVEAEARLLESYQKLEIYFKINPDAFCPDIVRNSDSIVSLYQHTRQFFKAFQYAKESERIKEFLVKQCSYAYLPSQASTYADLADILTRLNNTNDALEYLRKSQSIYEKLSEKSPDYYTSDLLYIDNIAGGVYLKLNDYEKANVAWSESLKIARELVEKEEEAYLSHLAQVLNNLGYFYLYHQEFEKSKGKLIECLQYRRKLAYQCQSAFMGDLIHPLNQLGRLFTRLGYKDEPENYFSEAKNICELLLSMKKEVYIVDYGETLHNFGDYYISINKFDPANEYLNEALKIRRKLCENEPDLYYEDLVESIQKISEIHIFNKRYNDAEVCLLEASNYCERLISINSEIFNPLYATTLFLWGKTFKLNLKFGEAFEKLKKSVFLREIYFEKNPRAFGHLLLESLEELKSIPQEYRSGLSDDYLNEKIQKINEKMIMFTSVCK